MRMHKLIAAAALLAASSAAAQVQVQINIPLPTVTFTAPPPLVVVEPGIQVVPDYDDEVYYVNEWYWVRRDARWFRMKGHGGKWVLVEDALVPRALVGVPPGKYRRFKGGKAVIVNPPGPGKIKIEKEKHHGKGGKHGRDND